MNYNFVKKNNKAIKNSLPPSSLHPKVVELLLTRGVDNIDEFIGEGQMHSPFLLKGMQEATKRIEQAIENQETILIYGDYDADGVCSTAILTQFLVEKGLSVYPHIPNRTEGYGLKQEILETLIENISPDLIITVDCGISNLNEVEFCTDLGVDIIITDHHEVSENLPNCTIVNPMQKDCGYPFKKLAGAGVVLKLIEALGATVENYLDLAAVATVADLMEMLGENRSIVKKGLSNIKNLGLKELLKFVGVKNCRAVDIAFKVAPRINAIGRMGEAKDAFELLVEKDISKIEKLLKKIDEANEKRKELCSACEKEAMTILDTSGLHNRKAIVVAKKDWPKGIIGILAARLTNTFCRPAFVISIENEICRGSCRGVDGISILEILRGCSDIIEGFGGHFSAAGFSIKEDKISEFIERVEELLKNRSFSFRNVEYDLEVADKDLTMDLALSLEKVEPFGSGFSRPRFLLKTSSLTLAPSKSSYKHTNITLSSGKKVMSFSKHFLNQYLVGEGEKHLILEVERDLFNNTEQLKLQLIAADTDKLTINDELAKANFIRNIFFKTTAEQARATSIGASEEQSNNIPPLGTLIIAGQEKSLTSTPYSLTPNLLKEFLYITNENNLTRLIVSPTLTEIRLGQYERIIFLDTPISKGMLQYINKKTSAEVFVPKIDNRHEILEGVLLDKESLNNYYSAIRKNANLNGTHFFDYLLQFKKACPEIFLPTLVAVIAIFDELGLIKIFTQNGFSLQTEKLEKPDLEKSERYRALVGRGKLF